MQRILVCSVALMVGLACGASNVMISGSLNTPETAYANGLRYLEENAFAKARASFQRAQSLDSDYAAAYEGLSRTAHAEGKTNDAIRHIQTAKIKDSGYAPAWIFTGVLYNSVNRSAAAIVEFQEALIRDKDELWSVTTYYQMALTYEKMDRTEDAYNSLGEVLKRDTLHMAARAGQERLKDQLPPGFFSPFRH
ncbi:MAG: hypothetical protein HOH43_24075 [Candidatus Latescibacteria bacterium]|nr:hypothetical protein [Candidatus Latescibacterota bacterium]